MSPPTESPDMFDKNMYMDILRENPPLTRYVSRGDMRDEIDVPEPHKAADRAVFRAVRFTMKDNTPRFQPILGGAGTGKTHLYWVLKDQEHYFAAGKFLAVYVPSPPSPVRIPLHLHACLVDEAGERLFEDAVDMLITKFGGLKGVTHEIYDYTYALERLISEYPGISADVVKVLLRYRLDPATHDLARRWLLGDALSDMEIERLGVRTILDEDDVTMATLKLLTEGSEVPIVLFVDEMEGPFNTYGEEGERHFLEVLKRIYNESKNVVIIASCLSEVWYRIYNIADGPTKSRMEPPVELSLFSRDDVVSFLTDTMSKYWTAQNVESPPDPLFPFDNTMIDTALTESSGVPREVIKILIPQLDSKLFDRPLVEAEPQADHVIKLTSTVLTNSVVEALSIAGSSLNAEVKLKMVEESKQQKSVILEITSEETTRCIGIDIPNVKDWDRSGGVAAFYAGKRLKAILDDGSVASGIIVVPSSTKGTKFEALLSDLDSNLLVLRFDNDTATAFIQETSQGILPHGYSEALTGLVDSLLS